MPTGLLEGQVSIVTGGADNLGAQISWLFAAQGASVVIDDVNADAGALVQRAVDEFGTVDAVTLLAGRIPLSPLAASPRTSGTA